MAKELAPIKILVVDDDKEICSFMETFLVNDGYHVKTLSDPSLALDEVKNGGYHIAILDIMMPKMDGIALLEEIRKIDKDIAVVIFTGFATLDTAVQSMKFDVIDYLKKPFDPDAFRQVIERVMHKKGMYRNPEENLHQVIGETVRKVRKGEGLTLKQMARRTGLSVSLLSQIERAESSASISSLFKISRALDVSIQSLFGDF